MFKEAFFCGGERGDVLADLDAGHVKRAAHKVCQGDVDGVVLDGSAQHVEQGVKMLRGWDGLLHGFS